MPNLIEVQKRSYERFLQMNKAPADRDAGGLQSVFKSIFPIRDFRQTCSLEFVDYTIGNWECKCGEIVGIENLRSECVHCARRLIAPDARGGFAATLSATPRSTDAAPTVIESTLEPLLRLGLLPFGSGVVVVTLALFVMIVPGAAARSEATTVISFTIADSGVTGSGLLAAVKTGTLAGTAAARGEPIAALPRAARIENQPQP
jgi:hypothetical protein